MYLVALTGGIAAGKSVVSDRLASQGAVIVDADRLAREVVEPGTEVLAAIVERFGDEVLAPDGGLDRAALGAIVFPDDRERAALNAITHPAVSARAAELFTAAGAADPHAVVVYDVPLFVEALIAERARFDLVVVVHAERDVRITRLIELRGMSREEAEHRVNAQATEVERLAVADVVIDTDGTLGSTLGQADELWAMARACAVSKQPE